MHPDPEIAIRHFRPGDEAAFRRLNEEWIARYFKIEPKDEHTFADPQSTILDRGGKILFAVVGNECVGCVALIRIADREFEVAKMAVTPSHQGSGIGRMLLRAAIDAAKDAGATRLYIETNHTLTPAIRLYQSLGFKHLDPARVTPSPYARADVFMEMFLN
jgi:putative acetyltransferase